MKQITPIILIRSVDFNRGGVTKASIKRANTLAKKHKNVIIATTVFQPNFQNIIQAFYDKGTLAKNIKVINFFDDLKLIGEKGLKRKKVKHQIKEKGYEVVKIPKHPGESYRYYKDGKYAKYKRFDSKGNLIFIDYRNNSLQRLKREEYTKFGYLSRIRHFNTIYDKPSFDQYINKNGKCFLSIHVNPETEKDGFTIHFSKDTTSYDNILDLQKEWLERILTDIKHPVIMSEQRRLDDLIVNTNTPNLKKVVVVHASHLERPYNNITNIAPLYKKLFKRSYNFDNIVVLTEEQKSDINFIYNSIDNIKVIPHAYEVSTDFTEKSNVKVDENNIIMIGRYVEVKRIDEAINAFRFVVDKLPNAKLRIYGTGPLEDSFKKLINKLKLQDNVFLMGYTTNAREKYRGAVCSILTSEREGFGMVITESMAEGTPVVSYDIKYGPSDIIIDGENGFLVENGNKKELAEKLIMILEDKNLRDRLSKNALEARITFSEKRYEENWIELINDI